MGPQVQGVGNRSKCVYLLYHSGAELGPLGKPEWINDPAYNTAIARQAHLMEIFCEAVNILRKFEIPCAPVFNMKDLAYDRDLRESGMVVEVPHKQRRTYLTVGSPMKCSAFKPEITASPLLGEHTNEVLAQLGYSAEQIAKFHETKVVGTLPPEPREHGWHDTIHAAAAILK
jgi:formyl-CoA transferase